MEVVIIKSMNPDHVRLITEFAEKLGDEVNLINEEDAEDYALGKLMLQKKTGREVSREVIMAKLRS
jgi:hypothetical protein